MTTPAPLRLRFTPQSHLLPEGAGAEHPLAAALERSTPAGLLHLAGARGTQGVEGPEFGYWREFALVFLHEICRRGDTPPTEPPAAAPEFLFDHALRVPDFSGAEYVSQKTLARLWDDLAAHALAEAAAAGGLRAWLARVNPALHTVGRVTFHLAENKRDPGHPFAFMATYVEKLSAAQQPVHIPLGRALQTYAGASNQAALKSLLEPVQTAAATSPFIGELVESRRVFAPQAWSPAEAYRFLREVTALEAAGLIVRIPNWWRAGQGNRPKVQVKVGEKAASGIGLNAMLDFQMETTLDGEPLTPAEWKALTSATDGLVLLRGQWVEADSARLKAALEQWKQLKKSGMGDGVDLLTGLRLLAGFRPEGVESAPEAASPDWSRVVAGDWLRERLDALRDPARLRGADPGRHVRATLRPYQAEGVRWLRALHDLGLGACLADDMGLGKTLQVITLLAWLKSESAAAHQAAEPTLLVAPASLLANWRAEVAKFAPDLRVGVAHPSGGEEEGLDEKRAPAWAATRDLVVTTYGQVPRLGWLSKQNWRLVVLDEAQAIKNAGTKQTKAVKALRGGVRVALSGTPVENRLGDLWSLFDFLNPGLLGGEREFAKYAGGLRSAENPDYAPLRRVVRPYILRRMKTDRSVIADLPDKTEVTAHCTLGRKQAALYQKSVEELKHRLDTAENPLQRRGLVLAFLTRFKQICNHPSHWLGDQAFEPAESGKFARLAEILEEVAARGEKALVFTQYQEMTGPLAAFLAKLFGRSGLVLDGSTAVKKRQEMVAQFQAESGPPFFVLSLKAGGTGLNLTAASHVVHFDRWWNPAVENQATDRAFRIGQKRNVLVHKFVCKGTVEERIDSLLREKSALADAVLGQADGAAALLTDMNNQELLNFVSLDLRTATGE